jgi:hypothetical protein
MSLLKLKTGDLLKRESDDLTDQVFGDWIVISKLPSVKRHTRWLCHCSCGNEVAVFASSLISGRSTSCGHEDKKIVDLRGRRFEKLLVVARTVELPYTSALRYRSKKPGVCWDCLCDCGKRCVVSSKNLLCGNTRSCGCLRIFSDPTMGSKKSLFRKYKRSAGVRGLSFEVDFDFFLQTIKGACNYCGCQPSQFLNSSREGIYYNGIDRLDGKVGYRVGNIVACCKSCNYLKWSKDEETFIVWLKRCYEHLSRSVSEEIEMTPISALDKRDPAYYSKNTLYGIYKNTCAIKRGLSFDLMFEEFFRLTQKNCSYCGSEPLKSFKKGSSESFHYNGIDRINNNLGYFKSNVVPCCFSCNASKMALDQEFFINKIRTCYDFMFKTGRL